MWYVSLKVWGILSGCATPEWPGLISPQSCLCSLVAGYAFANLQWTLDFHFLLVDPPIQIWRSQITENQLPQSHWSRIASFSCSVCHVYFEQLSAVLSATWYAFSNIFISTADYLLILAQRLLKIHYLMMSSNAETAALGIYYTLIMLRNLIE